MPYKMRKVYKKDCYKVYNSITKRVFAKCTTKEKATRQLAIIRNKVYNQEEVVDTSSYNKSKKTMKRTYKKTI